MRSAIEPGNDGSCCGAEHGLEHRIDPDRQGTEIVAALDERVKPADQCAGAGKHDAETHQPVATAAEIAAMTSPGMPPLSALAAGAAGLAAGAGAALAAGAAGACGLGSAGFLFFRSKSLPSRVMMRHRAISMAKTRVILVSTTVPVAGFQGKQSEVGHGISSFWMKHKTLFNKRAFICIIAQCELFW